MGLLTKLQSHLELRRLEKKYTTRKKDSGACYVDGEYIYQSRTPSPAHHKSSQQYISSSSTFAATQQHTSTTSSSSFTPTVLPVPSWTTTSPKSHTDNSGGSSSNIKHASWHSLTPSSIHASGSGTTLGSSARNSTLTTSAESPSPSTAISRNSRGQTWEPPKQGWGGDGTDAFKVDKKEFRFDVERDRRSVDTAD